MEGLLTERLLLPPLEPGHFADLADVYSDPDVGRYVGGDDLNAENISRQLAGFVQEWSERGYGQSAAILKDTGEFIGRIGLHYWPNWDDVELGYILRRSAQGLGYATEGSRAWIDWARADLHIDSLIANIDPRNQPSIDLAHKLGFTFERDDHTPTGKPTAIYRLPTPPRPDSPSEPMRP